MHAELEKMLIFQRLWQCAAEWPRASSFSARKLDDIRANKVLYSVAQNPF